MSLCPIYRKKSAHSFSDRYCNLETTDGENLDFTDFFLKVGSGASEKGHLSEVLGTIPG
jgi:hypothetical protein